MSQTGYGLFMNLCDLYYVLLQIMIFLAIWNIFFRPQRGEGKMFFAGIIVAANVFLCLCPGVPGGVRYVVSAAAVLGYCHIRYKRHLKRLFSRCYCFTISTG